MISKIEVIQRAYEHTREKYKMYKSNVEVLEKSLQGKQIKGNVLKVLNYAKDNMNKYEQEMKEINAMLIEEVGHENI